MSKYSNSFYSVSNAFRVVGEELAKPFHTVSYGLALMAKRFEREDVSNATKFRDTTVAVALNVLGYAFATAFTIPRAIVAIPMRPFNRNRAQEARATL